jgi:predicted secreted protein
MSVPTAIAIYFLIWWLMLFAVLPWGVRSQHEGGDIAPGTDPGAPVIPRLWWKLLWTTILSGVVFAILYVVYTSKLVTLDDMMRWMGMPRS